MSKIIVGVALLSMCVLPGCSWGDKTEPTVVTTVGSDQALGDIASGATTIVRSSSQSSEVGAIK